MTKAIHHRLASAITKRLSPVQIVFAVSMLVVVSSALIRHYTTTTLDPQIKLADYQGDGLSAQPTTRPYTATNMGDNDPAVRYADRLRDASALSISFSLYTLNERMVNNRIIQDNASVLDGLNKSGLMPPGLSVASQSGVVRSPYGLYYIRYRPNPFGVEILSVGGNGLADGEVFIIRLPDSAPPPAAELAPSQSAGGYATLYTAPRGDTVVPKPFASFKDMESAGWKQEPLRAAPYSPEQVQELKNWLAQYQKVMGG